MMKVIADLVRENIFLVLFFAFLSAMLLAPMGSDTLVPMLLDYFNHLNAIIQAKAALAEGQFPLRVAIGDQNGLRYPFYQFYSPTSYLLASSIYRWLIPSNPFIAYKMTIWLAYFIGGLYMYRLSDLFIKSKPAAILASVVYLTAPYNIILINQLAAFNEAIAIGMLPVVVYYTLQRYFYPHEDKTLIQTALVWYVLITVHLATFLATSFLMGILLLLITLKNGRHLDRLFSVSLAYIFGCLMAIWYLAPIAIVSPYLSFTQKINDLATFNAHKPFLATLLSPIQALDMGKKTDVKSVADMAIQSYPALGWFIVLGVAIAFCLAWKKQPLKNRRANYWLSSLLVVFVVGFIFVWAPFTIWEHLPSFCRVIQSSWRLSGQTLWVGALLFGCALAWLFKYKLDLRHTVFGVIFIVVTASACYPILQNSYTPFAEFAKYSYATVDVEDYLIDIKKYLAFINVVHSRQYNSKQLSALHADVIDMNETQKQCQQMGEKTVCKLDVPNQVHLVELPVLFYPDLLDVTINDHVVSYQSVLCDGRLITGVVPESGKLNVISAQFRGLPWANFMSAVMWLLWLLFSLFYTFKTLLIKTIR